MMSPSDQAYTSRVFAPRHVHWTVSNLIRRLWPRLVLGLILLIGCVQILPAQTNVITVYPTDDYTLRLDGVVENGHVATRVALQKRSVVEFDTSSLVRDGLLKATLVVTVQSNGGQWGSNGRTVNAHRLLAPCPWEAGLAEPAGPGVLITDNMTPRSELRWAVTDDVRTAGAYCGWLLTDSLHLTEAPFVKPKKGEKTAERFVDYYSLEGASAQGQPHLAPRLVLEYGSLSLEVFVLGLVRHAVTGNALAGVRATLAYGNGEPLGVEGVTEGDGMFRLRTPPVTGRVTLVVTTKADGFLTVRRKAESVLAGRCIRVDDILLTPLAPPVLVNPALGGVIEDPTGQVQLEIPPNAISGDAMSQISVTCLPSEGAAAPLPHRVVLAEPLFEISGLDGEETAEPVTLRVPNIFNLPAGTQIPFGKIPAGGTDWADVRDPTAVGQDPADPSLGIGVVKEVAPGQTVVEVRLTHF